MAGCDAVTPTARWPGSRSADTTVTPMATPNSFPCSEPLPRRSFLASVVAASAGIFLPAIGSPLGLRQRRNNLRVGIVIGAAIPRGAQAGIALGRAEAAQSAALFGDSVELETRLVGSPAEAATATKSLGSEWHAAAIVLAVADAETCVAVAAACDVIGTAVLNTICPSDALRGERCHAALFHVGASDAMRRDAREIADRAATRQDATVRRDTANMRVVAWHSSLEKYGGEQLNQRFRASAHDDMDDAAWAGWMAIKILMEATLRAHDAEGQALRAYLERPDARFDGHKGVPLSFRTWDRQLRQPLYAITGDTITEVPVARAGDSNARDRLDRLGPDSTRSSCVRAVHGFE